MPASGASIRRPGIWPLLGMSCGYLLAPVFSGTRRPEEAAFVVRVSMESMGTSQDTTFFGLPPIHHLLIRFALSQLTLDQEWDQLAQVRVQRDRDERGSGRLVRSTPWASYSSRDNRDTVCFCSFRNTDLIDPHRPG